MNQTLERPQRTPPDLRLKLQAATAHHFAGRLEEAELAYNQILGEWPEQPDVLHLLGSLQGQSGRIDGGIDLLSRAISLRPNAANYHESLARLLKRGGRLDDAIAAYRQAILLNPAFAEAHNNLGVALRAAGNLDAANDAFRRAIELKPGFAEAHNNLGHGLLELGLFDVAAAACKKAVELKPDYAEAYHNLANALKAKGEIDAAIAAYDRTIALKPAWAEAFNNLGVALWEAARLREATAAFGAALDLKPDLAEGHNNLGIVLRDQGHLDEAARHYQRALELKPNYAEAQSNLAVALKDRGQIDEAVEHARRSIQLCPDHAAHSNLIYLLHFHPEQSPTSILAEQQRWRHIHAGNASKVPRQLNHSRLRIGYIGPYFRDHVIGRNILPLLRGHDRNQFDVHCYNDLAKPDAITEQFRLAAGNWRDIAGNTDEQVAARIRADEIDILVDLCLHLAGNRLLVLARRPAPLQVTFAGYPSGTGLPAIGYRITDAHLDPLRSNDSSFVEKPLHITSFWCFDESAMTFGMQSVPQVGSLPALTIGYVTFGCLSNFCKINDGVLQLWSKVLHATPGSRLLLLAPEGSARRRTAERFAQLGIDPNRIEFVYHQKREKYFDLYNRIDVGLDPFPYNGHTTSLDSLWMGVPVVTLEGSAPVGRAGVSQFINLGLEEFVAPGQEDYVRIAGEWAAHITRLAHLRSNLREQMRGSPLMDSERFTSEIEAAYRSIAINTTR
jgi:protein O-GlcNAc transferase